MERLKTMFTRILWYKFLFVKVIHFGGRRDSIFNLHNVWHHSRGFEDSNISKSLENFILVMFYALMLPYLKKNVFIFKDRTLKKNNIERTRILRWFGQENEENVVRTRDWCCWPSSPLAGVSQSFVFIFFMPHQICCCSFRNYRKWIFLKLKIKI